MTTKSEKIAELKLLHPTLRKGSDEEGYTDLSSAEYKIIIEEWADNLLQQEAKEQEEAKALADKQTILAKIGLTADEAKLLLS